MPHLAYGQRGAALIVSLMMLLVMTVIGVAGMQTSVLEEKMAGNFRDKDLAFQTAEAALRVGEGIADAQASGNPVNNRFTATYTDQDDVCDYDASNRFACTSDGLCAVPDEDCSPRWEVMPETGPTGWTNATTVDTAGVLAKSPQYFIEYLGNDFACTKAPNACASGAGTPGCDCRRYRITARVPTSGNRARVMLQSVYATE